MSVATKTDEALQTSGDKKMTLLKRIGLSCQCCARPRRAKPAGRGLLARFHSARVAGAGNSN